MPRKQHAGHGSWRGWVAGEGKRTAAGRSRLQSSMGPRHGQIRGDTWHKTVRGSLHMLRTPRAWALDAADLDAAEAAGARWVAIEDRESGRTHWASVQTIRRWAFPIERGHGLQLALVWERWAASKAEAGLAEVAGIEQLDLWGGGDGR